MNAPSARPVPALQWLLEGWPELQSYFYQWSLQAFWFIFFPVLASWNDESGSTVFAHSSDPPFHVVSLPSPSETSLGRWSSMAKVGHLLVPDCELKGGPRDEVFSQLLVIQNRSPTPPQLTSPQPSSPLPLLSPIGGKMCTPERRWEGDRQNTPGNKSCEESWSLGGMLCITVPDEWCSGRILYSSGNAIEKREREMGEMPW